MKKKIVLLMLIITALYLVACGKEIGSNEDGNSVEKNSQVSNDNDDDVIDIEVDFSQEVMMVGYSIGCPSSAGVLPANYGKMFTFEKTLVLIESPIKAGIMLDVEKVEDAASVCQEYLIESVEDNARKLFTVGQTEQIMNNSSVVTVNGIDMLRVEGILNNIEESNGIPYVSYYFLSGTDPVFAIGIPLDETADVETFMDEFAKQIKKN